MKSPVIRVTTLTCMKREEVESITNVKDKRNFPEEKNIKSNHGSESEARTQRTQWSQEIKNN